MHDAFGIECLVDQVLVVSEDFDLLSQKDISVSILDNPTIEIMS